MLFGRRAAAAAAAKIQARLEEVLLAIPKAAAGDKVAHGFIGSGEVISLVLKHGDDALRAARSDAYFSGLSILQMWSIVEGSRHFAQEAVKATTTETKLISLVNYVVSQPPGYDTSIREKACEIMGIPWFEATRRIPELMRARLAELVSIAKAGNAHAIEAIYALVTNPCNCGESLRKAGVVLLTEFPPDWDEMIFALVRHPHPQLYGRTYSQREIAEMAAQAAARRSVVLATKVLSLATLPGNRLASAEEHYAVCASIVAEAHR